jgi:hypothetical protein
LTVENGICCSGRNRLCERLSRLHLVAAEALSQRMTHLWASRNQNSFTGAIFLNASPRQPGFRAVKSNCN